MIGPSPPTGFFGKLPARGDFLRAGLPRSFTDPFDAWVSRALTASRASLGERWDTAWRLAPVWRFALPVGACGPSAAAGLMLPSMDRVGRSFPLVIARLGPVADPETAGFLAAAASAGQDAIAAALAPEALRSRLTVYADTPPLPALPSGSVALWWTATGCRLVVADFPEPAIFARMLQPDAGHHDPESDRDS